MKYIHLIVLLLSALFAYSQEVTIPTGYEAKENIRELGSTAGTGAVQTFDNRYEGVKGTPFIFPDWHQGEVYLADKKKVFFNDMNYNSFENSIVYMEVGSNRALVLNKYSVDFFRIFAEDTLTFVPLQLSGESETIFAQVLYNRSSFIYKIYKKEFLAANYEGGYSADRKYDEFVDKYDLVFRKQNEDILYKVKNSKKYMVEAFEDQSDKISDFINKNKLKFKDDQDMVRLMEYYDSL